MPQLTRPLLSSARAAAKAAHGSLLVLRTKTPTRNKTKQNAGLQGQPYVDTRSSQVGSDELTPQCWQGKGLLQWWHPPALGSADLRQPAAETEKLSRRAGRRSAERARGQWQHCELSGGRPSLSDAATRLAVIAEGCCTLLLVGEGALAAADAAASSIGIAISALWHCWPACCESTPVFLPPFRRRSAAAETEIVARSPPPRREDTPWVPRRRTTTR